MEPMNAAEVIAYAQGRINYLALASVQGERDAAREVAVKLECECAKYEAALRAARIAVLKVRTVREEPFSIGVQLQVIADNITSALW